MNKLFIVAITLFMVVVWGCTPSDSGQKLVLGHSLNDTTDNGWVADFKFAIKDSLKLDTAVAYNIETFAEGKKIGLQVIIPNKPSGNSGFGDGIELKSLGSISDSLLMSLAKAYKVKADSTSKFVKSLKVSYVNLNLFVKTVENGELKQPAVKTYKLFFSDAEGNEAELFLVLSQKDKIIELNEKDTEYRPLIVKYLTAK